MVKGRRSFFDLLPRILGTRLQNPALPEDSLTELTKLSPAPSRISHSTRLNYTDSSEYTVHIHRGTAGRAACRSSSGQAPIAITETTIQSKPSSASRALVSVAIFICRSNDVSQGSDRQYPSSAKTSRNVMVPDMPTDHNRSRSRACASSGSSIAKQRCSVCK